MCAQVDATTFLSFVCKACHQEIEAPAGMARREAECPACGAIIEVHDTSEPGTIWAKAGAEPDRPTNEQVDAMKSRTIRIELNDQW
ncbi:MAG: hypothetical protein PHG96_01170 [Kiritimatiellae bacterium]|nr:hypothetical protein [Kiritimatiellia bacterium]MDD3543950.1 hypothetical protein [Kiritimatiellia bacterium]MDD4025599.1 hypothetical protein [Kiritimatiellia bacterium]